MFQDLPVWLVEDWGKEVSDKTIQEKAREFIAMADNFHWDKLFASGWFEEIWTVAYPDEAKVPQLPGT